MRNISAANSVASSPPVPARISSTMFFSSLGSLGTSRILSSSSIRARRSSRRASSSWAYSRSSASDSSAMMALLSWIPRCRSLYSRYFSTISATSLWALAVFWYLAESPVISGEDRALVSSSYFASIWFRRSNIDIFYCSWMLRNEKRFDGKRLRNQGMASVVPLNAITLRFFLGNHQFAAVGLLHVHGLIERL